MEEEHFELEEQQAGTCKVPLSGSQSPGGGFKTDWRGRQSLITQRLTGQSEDVGIFPGRNVQL